MRAKNTKFPPLPSSYFSLFPFPFSPVFFFSTSCGKIYFDASQQSCNARVKVECKVKPTRSGNILFALLSKKKKNYTYAPWCNKQQQLLRKNSSLWLPSHALPSLVLLSLLLFLSVVVCPLHVCLHTHESGPRQIQTAKFPAQLREGRGGRGATA